MNEEEVHSIENKNQLINEKEWIKYMYEWNKNQLINEKEWIKYMYE